VGDLTCLGQKIYNNTAQKTQWWGAPNHTEPQPHPLANFSNILKVWNNLIVNIDWQAPRELYWICGKQAYRMQPSSWFGSCILGTIRASFFLLPLRQGKKLGVPIYEEKLSRQKLGALQIGNWKDNKCPPKQIIQYFGPVTWAEDGSWGYCTLNYMLNHIIKLQTIVEIITSETARALNLLAKQSTKMCNAFYQNHLALDYLLTSEGGVCGKFNLSDCCLQIDDEGKVIKEITDRMRKLAHVPIQTQRGWNPNDLFGGWFSAIGGFKTLIGMMGLVLGACVLLSCLVPLSIMAYQDHYGGHYRKKNSCPYNDAMEI
jgi:hypothetical protein